MDRGEVMYKIPKECTTADEIRAYDKGFNDGYWNKPFHDAPDYKRFDNLRCMYANGRKAGQLRRKEETEANGRIYQG